MGRRFTRWSGVPTFTNPFPSGIKTAPGEISEGRSSGFPHGVWVWSRLSPGFCRWLPATARTKTLATVSQVVC